MNIVEGVGRVKDEDESIKLSTTTVTESQLGGKC